MGSEKEVEVEVLQMAASLNPDTPQKDTEAVSTVRAKRGRGRPPKSGGIAEREMETETETPSAQSSEYEKVREERIRANMERMQKLGLLDLSRDVKSAFLAPNSGCVNHHKRRGVVLPAIGSKKKIELTPLLPPRRSSRLQNVAPVVYTEARGKKSGDLEDANTALVEEGRREEYYTEEHEKLLGSTELPWTLFVDGYSKDGTRIYDPVKGKTCHQCRQKTLGYRTSCCKCQLVQGQFCGDCLYMRYGENVLEAIKNPDWICPACRGICNCSFCRLRKGWNPTGALYKKVASLGYKSVAHYLIQTRRKPANSSEAPSSETEVKSDETEAAKENQPKPETVSKKSNASVIVLSSGESSASDDEPGMAKRHRARREKEELYWENFAPGPVASRLRSRQKKV